MAGGPRLCGVSFLKLTIDKFLRITVTNRSFWSVLRNRHHNYAKKARRVQDCALFAFVVGPLSRIAVYRFGELVDVFRFVKRADNDTGIGPVGGGWVRK